MNVDVNIDNIDEFLERVKPNRKNLDTGQLFREAVDRKYNLQKRGRVKDYGKKLFKVEEEINELRKQLRAEGKQSSI